jgi:hypothetical protein
VTERQRNSLAVYNSVMNNYKRVEVRTSETRRGIIWWKVGVRRLKGRLKGVGRNSEQGICLISRPYSFGS